MRASLHSIWAALVLFLSGLTMALPGYTQDEISSFAFVQDDASLKVDGYLIYLYGIYVPPTGHTCYSFIRPSPCGSRAALALDFRISGDFVHCLPRVSNPDGSLVASCSAGNEDLSEWMLRHGWAVALPDAPFPYQAQERIARSQGIGIWGIPVERAPR
jgi:endonuclease YncB( thermonuclease family)